MTEQITALYIRLSQEDDNIGESNSVANQRDLLNDFVSKHPELSKTKPLHFVDDGYTGTNFDRPAVTDMLDKVRKGIIKNIVVKDFSRFGRNYIEVGAYLEQVFPFLGVRFLSVNDFFDSSEYIGKSAGLEVGFKTLLHDLYSRDLAIKSTSGKIAKTKKGEHIGGTAPFGYVKSKTVKNAWDIDESASTTVRRIFSLALEKHPATEIARILNADNLPTPLTHRKNNGTAHQVIKNSVSETNVWRREAVSRILRDERFTGKIVSGKSKRTAFGNVKWKQLPESEWIVVPDAHEPIVSQEIFDKVQSLLGPINQKNVTKLNKFLYAGKMFCGHCKHGLRRYGKPYGRERSSFEPRYVCRHSIELGEKRCLPKPVLEKCVSEVVLEAIKVEVALSYNAKQASDKKYGVQRQKREKLNNEVFRLTSELERLKNCRERLFEEYADGKLNKEQYVKAKAEQSEAIAKAEADIGRVESELSEGDWSARSGSAYDLLIPYADAKEMTHEMAALIKRVYVFADDRFEIEFDFAR